MKKLTLAVIIFMTLTYAHAQGIDKEKTVRDYYSGFVNHDWNKVANQFADHFTFTSPNNDDHIPLEKFKQKCWPTNKFFKKVDFIKMSGSGNNLFLLVEITTTYNKIVRNVDFFTFSGGKIKSIESFFWSGRVVSR